MATKDYVTYIGLLRVLEKRLLSAADIGRIVDAPTPEEALRQIGAASEYDFSTLDYPQQYEQVLKPAQVGNFERCYELCPDPAVIDIVATKYLFHNLKTALKAKLTGSSDEGVYAAITTSDYTTEELREAVFGEGELPDYLHAAADEAEEDYARDKNPQSVDVVVDKAMFTRQLALADEVGSAFIADYIRRSADYYNLLTTLRAKDMGQSSSFLGRALSEDGTLPRTYFLEQYAKSIPAMSQQFFFRYFGKIAQQGLDDYGRTGNFSLLERLLDDDLMEQVKKGKLVAFGPETFFCYLLAKENEIRQIRIIMAAKINQLTPERLSERLRENYV